MLPHYWQRAFEIGGSVYRDRLLANVDEQAGPAYFAAYPLSRWLFWQRLKWAARQIEQSAGQLALDFGCGFGLMLPHLCDHFEHVIAVDLVPQLATEFTQRWNGGTSRPIDVAIWNTLSQTKIQPHSVDLILALDVLEHFHQPQLDETIEQLASLLKPGGQLLVTGPTESWLYRLGRRIVGFSGQYHHQTIYDVERALSQRLTQVSVERLPAIMPLFRMSIYAVK